MAFSIESRVPYLDVRFVEYVASLPLDQKIRNGVTKIALRNAVKGIIPESHPLPDGQDGICHSGRDLDEGDTPPVCACRAQCG